MATKEYAIETAYGITTPKLGLEAHEALTEKGGVAPSQRSVLANAALILELLDDEEPQASADLAELAGIQRETSSSWARAISALKKAGLIQQHGKGPTTLFTRLAVEEPEAEEEACAPEAWNLSPHHTLIFGMAGSGKSNALHGIIQQLAPMVEEGSAKLYGIDPKTSELRSYAGSGLFEEVSLGFDGQALESHAELILRVRKLVKERSLAPSRENPIAVLIIEELGFLLEALSRKAGGEKREDALRALREILSMGRSLGVYVIGVSQTVIGRALDLFAKVIVLRQPSRYLNDRILGEGAAERGFDSTTIPAAFAANGFSSAGIGFMKDSASGELVKVRFPRVSGEAVVGS